MALRLSDRCTVPSVSGGVASAAGLLLPALSAAGDAWLTALLGVFLAAWNARLWCCSQCTSHDVPFLLGACAASGSLR